VKFSEWEPIYRAVCADFGFDPALDAESVRILRAVTPNSDLTDEDGIAPLIGSTVTVCGAAAVLEDNLRRRPPEGTLIAAGSAAGRVLAVGLEPELLVTDLDGEIGPQLELSRRGTLTLILAHGDNMDLVRQYAPLFQGPVVLTCQGKPAGIVLNFGGFTDGDRAVCLAREFGARKVLLEGFDFDHPYPKPGTDPARKLKKLQWAARIIGLSAPDLVRP